MRTYTTHTTEADPPLKRGRESHLDGSSMRSARPALILIDSRPLIREALVRLLEVHFRIMQFADVDVLAAEKDDLDFFAEAIILNVARHSFCGESARETIFAIRQVLGDMPIIVITDEEGIISASEALALDVKAYVTTSETSEVLIRIIRLVKAGGTFVPAASFAKWSANRGERWLDALPSVPDVDPKRLTKRQEQVLALIAEGKSNKIIAYELSMRESTVKSHVRQIMRKRLVRNRTELASLFLGTLTPSKVKIRAGRSSPSAGTAQAPR